MVLSVIKLTIFTFFMKILNIEGHLSRLIGSKVMAILVNGGFYLLVELHREGLAPAACAAIVITNFIEIFICFFYCQFVIGSVLSAIYSSLILMGIFNYVFLC